MSLLATLLTTVVPALLPAATDGVRAVINRVSGGAGAQPSNPEEYIAMQTADTDRLRALAEIDQAAGDVSRWVNNVRAMQRPAVGILILTATFAAVYSQAPEAAGLTTLAKSYVFYLFGDRTYMHLSRKR